MNKKNVIYAISGLVLLIVVIVAFTFMYKANLARKHDVNEPIEITWWHTLDSQYNDYISEIVDKFNQSNENITVKAEYMGSWSDINEALVAANASGTGLPAVAVCNTKFIAAYGDNNLFEDLTSYIDDTNYNISDFEKGIYSIATYGGKQIALPFLHNTQVIYYNKTIAKQYNLNIPKEFSEVDAFFKEVKEKTGMTPLSMQSLDFYYGTIYRNSEVNIIKGNKSDLNSTKSIEITTLAREWCKEGLISWLQGTDASSNMKQAFYDQKTFAVLHNSSALPTYIKNCNFEVGIAWYPGVNGVSHGDMGGGVIGIPSKNSQEVKNAAWMFIKYLCGEDINAEICIKTGNIPTRKSALNSSVVKDYLNTYPEYKVLYDNLDNIYPPFIHRSASEIVKVWQNYMNKVMLEYADPTEMLNNATKEINEILEES